jgi:hypothetical protein
MPDMMEFAPAATPGPLALRDRQRDLASQRLIPLRHDPASSGLQEHDAQRACPPDAARNVRWENVGLAVAVLLVASLWGGVIALWWLALR